MVVMTKEKGKEVNIKNNHTIEFSTSTKENGEPVVPPLAAGLTLQTACSRFINIHSLRALTCKKQWIRKEKCLHKKSRKKTWGE